MMANESEKRAWPLFRVSALAGAQGGGRGGERAL